MNHLKAYITGYALSLLLTLAPVYVLWMHEAADHAYPGHGVMIAAFVAAAVLQLLVQLYFFMHMGEERSPRYNFLALCFACVVVVILVGGTLWIMQELNARGHETHTSHTPFIEGVVTPQNSND